MLTNSEEYLNLLLTWPYHWSVFIVVSLLQCHRLVPSLVVYSCFFVPMGSPSRGGDVTVYVADINQPSLPTPFHSVLVSVSVFMALSTVFHSINSPDNSPLSHSVLPVLFLPYWSFQLYISLWYVSFNPDIIICGWLGLKHQLTNSSVIQQIGIWAYVPLSPASVASVTCMVMWQTPPIPTPLASRA